jgi:small GTP-binding protein
MPAHNYKFIMIGESSVGKTCMILRYTNNTFTETFLTTVGVDFKAVKTEVDGQVVQLQVWDTAGQEQFRTITKSYFRGTHGIILTFDVTSRLSFDRTHLWIQSIKEEASEDVSVILVGNKIDLDHREVTTEEGVQLAEEFQVPYIEASAKTGENIALVFETLARKVIERNVGGVPEQTRRIDFVAVAESSKKCC